MQEKYTVLEDLIVVHIHKLTLKFAFPNVLTINIFLCLVFCKIYLEHIPLIVSS